jgi:SpoVK/Ycf46/Vps4 family AAA+-type ATPase
LIFKVQIEVTLPDEKGRQEIFKIHTNKMAATGHLAADVDMRELAALTQITLVLRFRESFLLLVLLLL